VLWWRHVLCTALISTLASTSTSTRIAHSHSLALSLSQWLPEHSLDKNQQPTPPFKPHLVDLDEARQVFDADRSHSFELEEARRTLASLPIAAICSSDFEYMSGTWFWYEWLRTVKLLLASGQGHTTIEQLYAILHARDPSLEYDPAYGVAARGEPSDATMLSFFCGDNDRVRSLTIEELFSF